jgi:hypothetical protein
MIAGRSYEVKAVFSTAEYPEVTFTQLEPHDDNDPVSMIVSGSTRGDRENAAKRFAAALVEYGCRVEDMVFHDAEDVEPTAGP